VFASDKVADTIDYEQVALRIRALAAAQHYRWSRPSPKPRGDFSSPASSAPPWVKLSVAKIGILPKRKFVAYTIERKK